ncbi:MAG: AAA family ATPase, partial [Pseudanabaena sp.]
MQEQLSILIQAQYPLIYLNTPEEERAERAIATISQLKPVRRVFVWTSTRGIVEHGQATAAAQHNTESIQAALQWVIRADQKDPAIYIFKDAHPFFDHPVAVR